MNVEVLSSQNYRRVIQVNVPTRFYWDESGFDGVEFGPFPDGMTSEEESLVFEALAVVKPN